MEEVQQLSNYPWEVWSVGKIKTWNAASQEWTEGQISGKAEISALANYLPLSGDTEADVVTRSLSAIENVVYGFPNTSGTIGPDAEGNHYGGVCIGNNCVDIQDSFATMAVKWSGTKINAFGEITIKDKNGSADVVTYDTLIFPKTKTQAHYGTIATQEYVGGVLSAFPKTDEISATRVETMTTIHESDWADISASASSSTLYIVIPD
jgi:hypothetical protein